MYTYRFASSSSVHLTICVLKLDEDIKVEKAKVVLGRVLKMMTENGLISKDGLKVNIDGVDTFPDVPSSN